MAQLSRSVASRSGSTEVTRSRVRDTVLSDNQRRQKGYWLANRGVVFPWGVAFWLAARGFGSEFNQKGVSVRYFSKVLRSAAVVAVISLGVSAVHAGQQSVTLPDYFGLFGPGSATETRQAGVFVFGVPAGESVLGATISGRFGHAGSFPGTAPVRLLADGAQIASCASMAPCTSTGPTPWSYDFQVSELGLLSDGRLSLDFFQDAFGMVHLSDLRLSVTTGVPTPVPEPGSVVLMLGGLAGLFAFNRRRQRTEV